MLKRGRLPIGISSFPDLRNAGKIYIDKTALIGELAEGFSYVFLSRPRRFGKSLLVSTLASLFEHGLRDFKGLAIEKTWEEKTYPVIVLDFSRLKGQTSREDFQRRFQSYIQNAMEPFGFQYNRDSSKDFIDQLGRFFKEPACGQFVLLIDEYDAPLTEQLNNPTLFETYRNVLAEFFALLKSESGTLRFLFITGITKYRQVSIFSELNNLTDISLDPQFGELLGYTRREIETCFPEFLDNAVQSLNEETSATYTHESLMDEMIANYDGFSFDRKASTHVFAPWSVLNFLSAPQNGFENYWIGSGGVSTWLSQWIEVNGRIHPEDFDELIEFDPEDLGAASKPSDVPPETLLYQTGYLTIRGSVGSTLQLGYPNAEVKKSMVKLYFKQFVNHKDFSNIETIRVFEKGDVAGVVGKINAVLLAVPYDRYPIVTEAGVRGITMSYVIGSGLSCDAERHNANGRSDLEVYTESTNWVFEFKFVEKDAEAEKALIEAINQIREKRYGETTAAKKLIRLGMVFSGETRRIVAYEKLDE